MLALIVAYVIVQIAAPETLSHIISLWCILPFLATQIICHVMPILADIYLTRNKRTISHSSSRESVDIDNVTIDRICTDDDLRIAFLMFSQTCLDASSISFIIEVTWLRSFYWSHSQLEKKKNDEIERWTGHCCILYQRYFKTGAYLFINIPKAMKGNKNI